MARNVESTSVNPRMCPVCNHPERAEIERVVLSMGPSNPTLTLAAIADAFGVSVQELKVHTLMHTPLALDFSEESEIALIDNFKSRAGVQSSDDTSHRGAISDSNKDVTPRSRLTDKINLREGDMLLASANEMLTTLTTLGRRIKAFATDNSGGSDQRLANFCSTALVNLYVGTSNELRKNIEAIIAMDKSVNGEVDQGAEGLKALAAAIMGSESTESNGSKESD